MYLLILRDCKLPKNGIFEIGVTRTRIQTADNPYFCIAVCSFAILLRVDIIELGFNTFVPVVNNLVSLETLETSPFTLLIFAVTLRNFLLRMFPVDPELPFHHDSEQRYFSRHLNFGNNIIGFVVGVIYGFDWLLYIYWQEIVLSKVG